jgi:hypothetical protein
MVIPVRRREFIVTLGGAVAAWPQTFSSQERICCESSLPTSTTACRTFDVESKKA